MKTGDWVFGGLLVFIPLALYLSYVQASPVYVFACAAISIIPLSKYIGESTEELTLRTNRAVGGLLSATFGNAPELIIAIFALKAGLIDVVKASITGSILSNLLFGLGIAIFLGGIRHREQEFSATAAKASSSTLFLAVLALIIPAIFLATSGTDTTTGPVETLSIVVSILLIVAYIGSVVFSLWSHRHLYEEEAAEMLPRQALWESIAILCAATIVVSFVSDALVGSIQPLVTDFGWTQLFIGVVLLSIVGNASEYASAVRVALKNKMGLAFQISIGSATQIAMFVAPVLVLASLFFGTRMNLVFTTFELAALILSVLVVNSIVEDGQSNWFEGFLLIIAYAVIAAAFFLHP